MFPVASSVCITPAYFTLIYYHASFDKKIILVKMLWIRRKGSADVSMCHLWRHVIALLINFQLSAGIAILAGFKLNLCYNCIFIYFLNVVNYTRIQYWRIHGKRILGNTLFLFPLIYTYLRRDLKIINKTYYYISSLMFFYTKCMYCGFIIIIIGFVRPC